MTRHLSTAVADNLSRVLPSTSERRPFVDLFRGLLIAHMALDHASLMFNAGRGPEELASADGLPTTDLFQFLTRFTGVPVAPAFFFMAGFMVALTTHLRAQRGVAAADITRRLITRGLVLIAVDTLIMGLPRALMGFYSFMVLTSIGVAIIAVALLRHVSSRVLLPMALAVLILHPLLDVSALPLVVRGVLYEPVRSGAFRSLYPVIPWSAILLLGFVAGRDAITRVRPIRFWFALAATSFGAFLLVRLTGSYGNAYQYSHVASLEFLSFAKYPPDLPFLTWSFTCIFLTLPLLALLTRNGVPPLLHPLEIFGRVPFFFYVVHFYVLGITQAILRTKVGLLETYLIWVGLLVVMAPLCVWYYRKKRERPNFVTRYL